MQDLVETLEFFFFFYKNIFLGGGSKKDMFFRDAVWFLVLVLSCFCFIFAAFLISGLGLSRVFLWFSVLFVKQTTNNSLDSHKKASKKINTCHIIPSMPQISSNIKVRRYKKSPPKKQNQLLRSTTLHHHVPTKPTSLESLEKSCM